MEESLNKLTAQLLAKNPEMPVGRARVWIELLWSDFEATSAKRAMFIVVLNIQKILYVSSLQAMEISCIYLQRAIQNMHICWMIMAI